MSSRCCCSESRAASARTDPTEPPRPVSPRRSSLRQKGLALPRVVRIIGVGNPLMGDDGAGIAAVERLAGLPLPAGVAVVDGGTGGLTLLQLMEGAEKVVLVDAVEMGAAPGTLGRFAAGALLLPEPAGEGLSLHATGLPEVFALGRELGLLPAETVILGVQPASVERRLGLSPPVAAALDELVRLALAETAA